ncbi:MAG: alpha/beta hydrolase [Proteobacteria bacterium]|nr:alpha/beta hydrolase [Pseudomonadota bacterium]
MRRTALAFLLLLLPAAATSQSRFADATTIGRVDSLWSPTLKENRKVLIYTPPSYHDTKFLPRNYPVLFLLDGDAHFHSVTGLLQILGTGVNGTYVVPEMIVVAIPNTDRTRDLTATHTDVGFDGKPTPAFKTSGGGPNFLHFIKAELIPHIDSTYRTTDYRMLVGHSFGGITVIDALYTMPETFNAYVAIDPSLWWDHHTLLDRAKGFFSKPGLAGKALYVGQANTITPDDSVMNPHFNAIVQFNSVVEAYNQSGIRYAYKYYPADDHGSVPLISEYDALRFIFGPYKLNLMKALDDPSYVTAHFAEVSRALGTTMLPPEAMVNQLGYIEMQRDTTKAIALFQLNADLYPRSPNVWAALGDGWQAKGDAARARSDYDKALALDPKNAYAAEKRKKLDGAQR